MVSEELKKVVARIKSLKVQGASNVKKAALQALAREIKKSKAQTKKAFKEEFLEAVELLMHSRITEPAMQTPLKHLKIELQNKIKLKRKKTKQKIKRAKIKKLKHEKNKIKNSSLAELKQALLKRIENYEIERKKAIQAIVKNGLKIFKKKSTVFTHCHSSTVMELLKQAHRKGKLERVIVTETRPLMQGHLTARELLKAKVPVTLIVDSAGFAFMQKADLFITGADAITKNGVINKVGTAQLSLAAHYWKVPHFVAASTGKFIARIGIEERKVEEVWKARVKGLQVENPAFDLTPKKLVKGIITEKGIKEF